MLSCGCQCSGSHYRFALGWFTVCTVACPSQTHMLYTACADPERFARGGPTLTTLLFYFYERREDSNTSKGWPSSTRQRNSIEMAFIGRLMIVQH